MLLKATTGTTMGFTFYKSEMILTLISRLLGGTLKKAESKKTSKPMSLDLDSSILRDLCQTLGDLSNQSSVPLR